jgi:hypothetical protein
LKPFWFSCRLKAKYLNQVEKGGVMEEGKKEEMLERIMIEYGIDLVRLAFS